MKTLTTGLAILFASVSLLTVAQANTMENIEARIGLGLTPDAQGFPPFFAGGFTQGDTSYTNTLAFDDGVVKIEIKMTVEGFDSGGSPAGLIVNNQATGVELGVVNNQLDTGESLKFTFDDISFSTIGVHPMGPVDVSSFEALLSSLHFAAFDNGTDTYTYSGVGAGVISGDDTNQLEFTPDAPIVNGDMFTVKADSGAFRALFISAAGTYRVVPEPATLGLLALSLLSIAAQRRKN